MFSFVQRNKVRGVGKQPAVGIHVCADFSQLEKRRGSRSRQGYIDGAELPVSHPLGLMAGFEYLLLAFGHVHRRDCQRVQRVS